MALDRDDRTTAAPLGSRTYTTGRDDWLGRADWPAIWASVFSGLGITLLLVALGSAIGLESGDSSDGEGDTIATAVGVWTVVAALIGAFVGSFIGARFARYLTKGSAIYHAITSWGLTTVLAVLLASFGAAGLLGTALNTVADNPRAQATANQADTKAGEKKADKAEDEAADAASNGGWAVTVGLLLTLLAAMAGWYLGARQELHKLEREDAAATSTT